MQSLNINQVPNRSGVIFPGSTGKTGIDLIALASQAGPDHTAMRGIQQIQVGTGGSNPADLHGTIQPSNDRWMEIQAHNTIQVVKSRLGFLTQIN